LQRRLYRHSTALVLTTKLKTAKRKYTKRNHKPNETDLVEKKTCKNPRLELNQQAPVHL